MTNPLTLSTPAGGIPSDGQLNKVTNIINKGPKKGTEEFFDIVDTKSSHDRRGDFLQIVNDYFSKVVEFRTKLGLPEMFHGLGHISGMLQ